MAVISVQKAWLTMGQATVLLLTLSITATLGKIVIRVTVQLPEDGMAVQA